VSEWKYLGNRHACLNEFPPWEAFSKHSRRIAGGLAGHFAEEYLGNNWEIWQRFDVNGRANRIGNTSGLARKVTTTNDFSGKPPLVALDSPLRRAVAPGILWPLNSMGESTGGRSGSRGNCDLTRCRSRRPFSPFATVYVEI
jgi:hypothetical protein